MKLKHSTESFKKGDRVESLYHATRGKIGTVTDARGKYSVRVSFGPGRPQEYYKGNIRKVN